MTPSPSSVFKFLGDETRLRILLLLRVEGELCVCEIAAALALSQPKVSRHLAQLRSCGLLQDARRGQWIYYQLNPDMELWIAGVLTEAATAGLEQLRADRRRLEQMGDRPKRRAVCC